MIQSRRHRHHLLRLPLISGKSPWIFLARLCLPYTVPRIMMSGWSEQTMDEVLSWFTLMEPTGRVIQPACAVTYGGCVHLLTARYFWQVLIRSSYVIEMVRLSE